MKPLKPMWDDPGEAEQVRDLLEAGRGMSVDDYDFDKGLSDHLAHVAAGTPAPDWASELIGNGSGAVGAKTAAAGLGVAGTVAWVAVPIVAAGVVAATLVWNGDAPAVQAPARRSPSAVVAEQAAPSDVPEPSVEPTLAETTAAVDALRPQPADVRQAPRVKGHTTAEPRRSRRVGAKAMGAKSRKATLEDFATRSAKPTKRTVSQSQALAESTAPVDGQAAVDEAPAEDLHEKWARGVNANNDPAADALDTQLEREMRMLKVAQAALASNPTRALQLARRGERDYGDSMFQAERQHVLILALVKLGRLDEARRVAKPYLRKYPNGPFSARVRNALAASRDDR